MRRVTCFFELSRRAGQRFDSEHGVTTEALIFLGELDPEAIGPSIDHATHYEPTPLASIDALLDAVPPRFERMTFVDIGSGMGRVVFVAARRPFRAIVGVEISPALHAVATQNRSRWSDPRQRCRDVRLVCRDALDFRFPRGDLVVYFYNPFDTVVMEAVAGELALDRGRDVTLLYNTPTARAAIEATGAFRLVAELPAGVVYRLLR